MKMEEIQKMTVEELEKKLIEIEEQRFALVSEFQVHRQSAKPHLLRALKRTRARILTHLNRPQKETNDA